MTTSSPLAPAHLRRALLAALALLALGIGVTPGQAVAASGPAGTSDADTITTTLYPGWNMVGWVGPSTPTSELFDAIPALRQVSAWDAEAQAYQHALHNRYSDLPTLTGGMGLWLLLGGYSNVEWTRPVSDVPVLLFLHEGLNIVGWTGAGRLTAEDAAAQLGEVFVSARRWDAETQRYLRLGGSPVLNRGDALRIDLARDASWWQSGAEFVLGEELTEGRRAEILEELRGVVTFFAEQHGILPPRLSLFSGGVPNTRAVYGTGGTRTASSLYVGSDATGEALAATLAHEYFHVLQEHIWGGTWSPAWMVDGSATYAAAVYVAFTRRDPANAARGHWVEGSNQTVGLLSNFEHKSRLHIGDRADELGALAVDWLVRRAAARAAADSGLPPVETPNLEDQAGHDSHIEYHRLLRSSGAWQGAFAKAFGISARDFYEEFRFYRVGASADREFGTSFHTPPEELAGYQPTVAAQPPHTTDDVVRPAIAFFGDVPANTRTSAETLMLNVHTLLMERFGAEPYEYSVYFSEDEESAIPVLIALRRTETFGTYGCHIQRGQAIFYVMTCNHALSPWSHINTSIDQLKSNISILESAFWLWVSVDDYAAAVYEVEYWRQDLKDDVRQSAQRVAGYEVPLRQLATAEGWIAGDPTKNRALMFLGVYWLAEHAGEPALLEYYRLLPRGHPARGDYEPRAGSGPAAFEQAFGLTLEDFYEQFEAYRETLTAE